MPDPIQGVRGALRAAPPAEQGALEGVFTGKAALEKRERKKPAVIVLKMNDSPLAALARLALGSSGLLGKYGKEKRTPKGRRISVKNANEIKKGFCQSRLVWKGKYLCANVGNLGSEEEEQKYWCRTEKTNIAEEIET
ncbi:hypothetical protein Anapl_06692 [Anas platyrhynchos]|uniref:Uncharacterized protein n=1 Tax=Anas platyrhynchos TaxID=8839 RepID=R0LY46_ANAPL|nr:hypothetical protein Anapl_06692 [Anas platyrhynchos]